MAAAEIIGAAIGVLLLMVVAYVVVSSTLTAAETVATAQKDLTLQNEARLRTSISLNRSEIFSNTTPFVLNFSVTNTGNEIISDFDHTDIYTWDGVSSQGYQNYTYDKYNTATAGNWSKTIENDLIHPNQLDPGEKMWVTVNYNGAKPTWFQVTTSNGVYAQTTYA
jgi:archaeal flagellar protein FlaF